MDVGKMDKMDHGHGSQACPPLLSPNLKVFGLKTRHCALTRKNFNERKTGKKFEGKTVGSGFAQQQFFKTHKCYKRPLNSRHSG